MLIRVTADDIQLNPACPIEPALKRLTNHDWLVGVNCAERRVEVDEEGDKVFKTVILVMPQVAYDYISDAAAGKRVEPIEFEVGEPILLD
jgi:hypothetical protein